MLPAEAKRFMPRLLTGLYSYRTAAKNTAKRQQVAGYPRGQEKPRKKQTLKLKETEHFAMRRGQKGAQR